MPSDRNSYKSITKAISLFGGVKLFQILIGIIKNKFVAVLLGPAGMGIVGLITSSTSTIAQLTGFGLQTSSVRDVSKAYSSGNRDEVNKIVTVLRKLILLTGILGTVVTFFLASYLSKLAFGNLDYTIWFRVVSVILFLDQVCIGQTVLMQGTFHYKLMAKSAILGSIVGLFTTIPFYYLWGKEAIVPVIVLTSFFHLLFTWIYSKKVEYTPVKMSFKEIFSKGKIMITLGIAIALTGVINIGSTYLLRLFISNIGTIEDVGLYTAGITIATSYIAVIFTAMGTDYSPRLAAIASDTNLFIETINKQAILLITLISPLVVCFIVFVKYVILLLYSSKFLALTGMIEWMMFAMIFRAFSWAISYCFVARGDAKFFFWNELLSNILSLLFSIVGYKLAGLTGMGIAFCLNYVIYSLQVYLFARRIFKFNINKELIKIILPQIILVIVFFVVIKFTNFHYIRYIVGCLFIIMSSYLSYKNLDNMIGIKELFYKLIKRKR